MSTPNNIILCGFMGTGKTTIGRQIAKELGWKFVDTDKLIEERCGKTVSDIFAQDGEAAFREMERKLCGELAEWRESVIATGGGIVLNPDNRNNLEAAGLVVCLEAPAQEIVERLAGNTDRPLLAGDDPAGKVEALLTQRADAYAALPHHVNTSGKTPTNIANEIIALWKAELGPSEPTFVERYLKPLVSLNLPLSNPVYKRDVKDIQWLKGRLSPQRWGWTRLGVVYAAMVIISIMALIDEYTTSRTESSILVFVVVTVAVGSFFSWLYGLLADVRYVMLTTSAISDEIVTGQWDVLRLTRLSEQDIIKAKHGVAIVRSWQVMTFDRAFSTAPLVAQLILQLGIPSNYYNRGSTAFSAIAISFLFGLILPYWRMRAITIVGLALSSRVHLTSYSALAGFAVAFSMKLVQLAIWIMTSACLVFSTFFVGMSVYGISPDSSSVNAGTYLLLEFIGLVGALIPALVTLFVYVLIESIARSFAFRTAFYSDRQP